MKVAIIIPAYNEEKIIGQVLDGVKKVIDWAVVVDDGSTDKTAQIAKDKGVEVLHHLTNCGQGAALKTGSDWAAQNGADIIVHFDADGQHLAEDIKNLIEPVEKGEADIVLGSRFIKASKVPFTKKYFILTPAIFFNWFLTGVKLSDAHNGLRALTAEAWQKINLTQAGMAHGTEILSEIKRNNLRYKEVGVTISYQQYGQGLKGGLKIIKDLIKGKVF